MLLAPAHIKDGFLGCREFFFLFFRANYSDLLSNGIHYILPPHPPLPPPPFPKEKGRKLEYNEL
jgi:hypothetical protein